MRVNALTQAQLEMFAQNNIFAYDPSGSECYSGNLSGNTIMAKVVNYLKGDNPTGFVLSDTGIAGVLANFQGESGFNPFRFEGDSEKGPGYGIAQFTPMSKITDRLMSDSRTSNYFNQYFDLKYTYYNSETGLPTETLPMSVIDAWLLVQLDYFFGPSSEFENTKVGDYRDVGGTMGLNYINSAMTVHEALNAAVTAEDATRIFVWIMERPSNKEVAANERSQNAQKWYEYSKAIFSSNSGFSNLGSSLNGSNVTIIGDSITVGSETEIRKLLPQADIKAQVGKQFYEGTLDNPGGISILKDLVANDNLREVLIFALGTNSGGVTEAQVKEVVQLAGSSRKVVFVTNFTTSNDYIGNNNNFIKIKNENSNVFIADWKSAIESQPTKYLSEDGIHPNTSGQTLFASIISNVVGDVDNARSFCGGTVEGGLTIDQAQKLVNYYNSPNVVVNWGTYGKKNCVAFSWWFTTYFTNSSWAAGDGKDVAHEVARANGLEEGNDPRPFAIFSVTRGSTDCGSVKCGHTGIVVNVNGDKITVAEAAYGEFDGRVAEYDLSYFENKQYGYTFTYLDSVLDKTKLSEVIGN